MTRKVINGSDLPTRLPALSTAVAYILLDKFHAPGWVWGVVGTVYAAGWILSFVAMWMQKPTPVAWKDEK